jgi:cytochrome c-type biogenesis protein CcmH
MTLWFVLALMTAAAVFAVLWPLSRTRATLSAGQDMAVYADQIAEIERDRTAGLIPEVEAAAARVEVSRRLLAAADANEDAAPGSTPTWHRRVAALIALMALPLGAGGLYLSLGSPQLPDQPLVARLAMPLENSSVANLVARVESHLERNPEDGRGWEVVAPVYMRLGRFDDAVKARRNALRLNGESTQRWSGLGDALVAAANGVVTAEAKSDFERALALDPQEPKARFFIGLAAEQDGKREEAASIWRELLKNAPSDAPWLAVVHDALARAEGAVSRANAGPSAEDVAAAESLSPQQRTEMIRGMVERLSTRLKTEGGADIEGWLRLVRAYAVLGEREKARAAASDARRALAGDSDKVRRLDELVKDLGLES